MKLNLQTDFTKLARATSIAPAGEAGTAAPDGRAVLAHDERHLRRRVVELADGGKVLVDLPEPVALNNRDRLLLEDGRQVEIVAAEEELYAVRARNPVHLVELAWHIGNRHLAAQIEENRLVILRDHVIKAMLQGLGATVTDVVEPFSPARGAYSGHDHGHSHGHDHSDGHGHGERDRFGRLPGDPHYGHNHD
ncbi:urease accessory protein UreE [Mesorhizobium sp. ZC-5]|uniref:urease accessory protein UreE n=1 Tax=Mesorhizobium sp. ZC-5 TaxID=2986066 RepID=UPI0021E7B120|nr:urease accessory protein UreE [Mesorhizobium sp. ZC-5]MCV3239510.1 urease accessory protein UreE [Mesorhizobium sp. ZC-5]